MTDTAETRRRQQFSVFTAANTLKSIGLFSFFLSKKKKQKTKTLPVQILLEEFINTHLFNVPFIVPNLLSSVRVFARVSRHTLCELTPSLGFTMWASSCEACSLRGAAVVVAARLCCDFALAFPALA